MPIHPVMVHAFDPRPRIRTRTSVFFACVACALVCAALWASTGFGATSASISPSAEVVGSLTLTDPTTLTGTPPVCTDALAPTDTDDCTDVSLVTSPAHVLRLGSLAGADVQAGSLTWQVTTSNPTGYQVYLANAGGSPVLTSGSNSIADMQSTPMVPATAVDDATHFGVAMGNPAADNEVAVAYVGSPWVTAGSQQGELFRGIPTVNMLIAEHGSAQTNDPLTATFAVAAVPGTQPAPGAYAGTLTLTALAI